MGLSCRILTSRKDEKQSIPYLYHDNTTHPVSTGNRLDRVAFQIILLYVVR